MRKLRLLLVNPNIVMKKEHVHMGIAMVGSWVRHHSDHEVKILDFMATPTRGWKRKLEKTLQEYKPDLVAMYLSTPYFPAAKDVATEIKRHVQVPLVGGGHHATLATEDVLGCPAFDWALEGDGEIPMLALLNALAAGESVDSVPGLWRRDGDKIVQPTPKAKL